VSHGAGAALHGEAHRLIEHQHVGIFVERDRAQERAGLFVLGALPLARFRRFEPQRGNAHRLPGCKPILRLDPPAVHPQLAFADDALDMGERKPGKSCFEKAVDPHAGFIRRHGRCLNPGRRGLRGFCRFPRRSFWRFA
jgi:hypothetical protein